MEPEAEKYTGDFFEALDHSILQQPVNIGIKNVQQILSCIQNGNSEVQNIVLNECTIVYECKVCRNLFRALPNLIAHKRFYCKEPFCRVYKQSAGLVQDETVVVQPEDAPVTDFEDLSAETQEETEKTDETVEPQVIRFESPPIFTSPQKASSEPRSKSSVSTSKDNSDQEEEDDSVSNVIQLQRIEGNPNAVFMSVAASEQNPEKPGMKTPPEEDKTPEEESSDEEREEEETVTEQKDEPKQITELRKTLDRNREKQLLKMTDCDVKTLTCLKCNKIFASIKSLYYHIQSIHTKKRVYYPCPLCKTSFAQIWGVTRHMSTVHRNSKEQINKFREHIIKRAFVKKVFQGDSERDKVTPTKDNVCMKCGRVFLHKSSKINHIRCCEIDSSATNGNQMAAATEGEKVFSPSHSCFKCGRVFEYKTMKEAHQKYCIGNQEMGENKNAPEAEVAPMHRCLKCGRLFERKTSQIMHTKHCTSNTFDPASESQSVQKSKKVGPKTSSRFSCFKCGRVFKLKSPQISHTRHCHGKSPDKGKPSSEADVKPLEQSTITKKQPLKSSTLKALLLEKDLVKVKSEKNTKDVKTLEQNASVSTRPKRSVGRREDLDFVSSQSLKWVSANRVESMENKQEQKDNPSSLSPKKKGPVEDSDSMLNVQELKDNKVIEGKVLSTINLEKLTCMRCQQKFASLSNAKRHVAIHHIGYMRFKCKHCTYKSYNKSDCRKHILRVHRKEKNGSSELTLSSIKKEPGVEDIFHKRKVPNPHVAVKKLNLPSKVDTIKVASLKDLDFPVKKTVSPRNSVSKFQHPSLNLNMSNRPVAKQIFIRKPKPLILQNTANKKATSPSKQISSVRASPSTPALSKKPMPLSKKNQNEKSRLDLALPSRKKNVTEKSGLDMRRRPMPLSKRILAEGTRSPDLPKKAMPLSKQILDKKSSPSPQGSVKKPMPLSKKNLIEGTPTSSPELPKKAMPLSKKNLIEGTSTSSPELPKKAMPLSKKNLTEVTSTSSQELPKKAMPLSKKKLIDRESTSSPDLPKKPMPLSKKNLIEGTPTSSPELPKKAMPLSQKNLCDKPASPSPQTSSLRKAMPLSKQNLSERTKSPSPPSSPVLQTPKPLSQKNLDEKSTPPTQQDSIIKDKPLSEQNLNEKTRSSSPEDFDYDLHDDFDDSFESSLQEITIDSEVLSDSNLEDSPKKSIPQDPIKTAAEIKGTSVKRPAAPSLLGSANKKPCLEKKPDSPAQRAESPDPDDEKFKNLLESAKKLFSDEPEEIPKPPERVAIVRKPPQAWRNTTTSPFITKLVRTPTAPPPQPVDKRTEETVATVVPKVNTPVTPQFSTAQVAMQEPLASILKKPVNQPVVKRSPQKFVVKASPQRCVVKPPIDKCGLVSASGGVEEIQNSPPPQDHAYLANTQKQTVVLLNPCGPQNKRMYTVSVVNQESLARETLMLVENNDSNSGDNVQYVLQNPDGGEGQEVVLNSDGSIQYIVQNPNNLNLEGHVQYVVHGTDNTDQAVSPENQPSSSDNVRYVLQSTHNGDVEMESADQENDLSSSNNIQYVLQNTDNANSESDPNCSDNIQYVVQNADGTADTSQVVFQGNDPISGEKVHYVLQNADGTTDPSQVVYQGSDPVSGENFHYVVQNPSDIADAPQAAFQEGDSNPGDSVQYIVQNADNINTEEQAGLQDQISGDCVQEEQELQDPISGGIQNADHVNTESQEVALQDPISSDDAQYGAQNADNINAEVALQDPVSGDTVQYVVQNTDVTTDAEMQEVFQGSDPNSGDNIQYVVDNTEAHEVSFQESGPVSDDIESIVQNDNVVTSVEMQ